MKHSFSRLLAALCCLLTITLAHSSSNTLKPFRTLYGINYDFFIPVHGTAVRELSQNKDGSWLFSHKISSTLLTLNENSHFLWQQNQPKPLVYQYQQSSLSNKRNVLLEFDWDKNQVRHTTDKPPGSYAIIPGTLDKLSYQLMLRHQLLAHKNNLSYSVADKRKLRTYDFEVVGEEPLNTAVGILDTVKIKRSRDADADRQTTLWLAKDWDYMLVKIKQDEKGKSYEVMMTEGELDGQPVKGR